MSLRFKGSDLRPVLAEAVANQCRVVLAKDQGCTSSPSRESAVPMAA